MRSRIYFKLLPTGEDQNGSGRKNQLPEQFEKLFNDILSKVNKRIIIVFDNVDRVQGDTAIKILLQSRHLDPLPVWVNICYPCDSVAINNQIEAFYKNPNEETFEASEYLRNLQRQDPERSVPTCINSQRVC